MQTITTIGLDIAKSVFQVHGVDAAGQVAIRRQLKRRAVLAFFQKLPSCLVGIEACASSHHWSRELQALGHTVRLMPPAYVTRSGFIPVTGAVELLARLFFVAISVVALPVTSESVAQTPAGISPQ